MSVDIGIDLGTASVLVYVHGKGAGHKRISIHSSITSGKILPREASFSMKSLCPRSVK